MGCGSVEYDGEMNLAPLPYMCALGIVCLGNAQTLAGIEDPAKTLPLGNRAVLLSISELPRGGGYSTSVSASEYLKSSIGYISEGYRPPKSGKVFCSSVTYLVLLASLKKMEMAGRIKLSETCWAKLKTVPLPDGQGPWGIWNSNGPGAAGLLQRTGLGKSFSDITEALPGDFLKFFWTPEIGAKERGHLVVFLGVVRKSGRDFIRYWSANKPEGTGIREVEVVDIYNPIFTRLCPSGFASIPDPSFRDELLVKMKTKIFKWESVARYLRSAPASPPASDSKDSLSPIIFSNSSTE